ncbi:hypothetical protein BLNAU_612 [Blattamonas nauphoetae]|uniref:Acid phosphatase n=1 Tax=Blattamonas nauphoetae TaxID=2049346 RepID=A0ABQ9YLR3_9EUKA|nr:hypothetical protein BLNAU_612 [Blattamonas nauphoetae]
MYFHSTSNTRTLLSAHANIQGLFYQEGGVSKPIPSVPIFSYSTNSDVLQGRKTCKKAINAELTTIYNSPEWSQKEKENSDLLKQLSSASGLSTPISLLNISDIGDALYCANHSKRSDCLFSSVLDVGGINLHKWTKERMYNATNDRLAKMRISTFVNHVLTTMQSHLQKEGRLYHFYSGHDGNLLSLIQLFKQRSPGIVPFASAFIFELHKINQTAQRPFAPGDVGVKLKYFPFDQLPINSDREQDSFYDRSDEINLPWNQNNGDVTREVCGNEYCSLSSLQDMTFTQDKWEEVCGLSTPGKQAYPKWLLVLSIVLGGLILCVVVALLIVLIQLRKTRHNFAPSLEPTNS